MSVGFLPIHRLGTDLVADQQGSRQVLLTAQMFLRHFSIAPRRSEQLFEPVEHRP